MANTTEDWMNRKWRPAMGWTYMAICILDFAIFPILWSLIQATQSGSVSMQWDPITLRGAGLFHMAMGTVLGIAAWTRGQEKLLISNQRESYTEIRQQDQYQPHTGYRGKLAPPQTFPPL